MIKESDRIKAQLLEECANLLSQGDSLASCLARYPEEAPSLAPMLQTVVALRGFGAVPLRRAPDVAAARRAQFMAAALQVRQPAAQQRPAISSLAAWWAQVQASLTILRPLPVGLIATLVVTLLAGVLATSVLTASAGSLPGDPLYGVKLATEQARLWLTLNPASRDALDQQLQSERANDAAKILEIRRPVQELPLAGRLETYDENEWTIGGLVVAVDAQTTVVGKPAIGALVRGHARAPGDGSLVATYLSVEGPATNDPATSATAVNSVAPSARPPAMVVAPQATRRKVVPYSSLPTPARTKVASPRPVVTVAAALTRASGPVATGVPPTPTSRPGSVIVPTNSPRPPSPTLLPASPTPRPEPKVQIVRGSVTSVGTSRWVMSSVTAYIDGNTSFVGNPAIGDLVDATLQVRADGTYLALEIRLVARAVATPAPFEFTGIVQAKGADTWTIGGTVVKILASTTVSGSPQIGDTVHCSGARYPDGIRAQSIEKLAASIAEFSGIIQAIRTDSWMVSGRAVYLGAGTKLSGATPAVGRLADVRASQGTDGRLTAQTIFVRTSPSSLITTQPQASATRPPATRTSAPPATVSSGGNAPSATTTSPQKTAAPATAPPVTVAPKSAATP